MGITAQRLRIGQIVEVGGRLYDVVWDKAGGATLEPAVLVTMEESYRETGGRPASAEEIETALGNIPSDGEG